MNISDKLTQEKVLDILLYIYESETHRKDMEAKDLITELKQQILAVTSG